MNLMIIYILKTSLILPLIIAENCEFDKQNGICKDISKCINDHVPIPGLCEGEANIQCCIKKDEELIKKTEIKLDKKKIIENIKNNLNYTIKNKKDAMIEVATDMLNNDRKFDPRFIAGLLANLDQEITKGPGEFESSYYTKNNIIHCYLQCMNDNYDYLNTYSGKKITDIGINKIIDLSNDLKNKTKTWKLSFNVSMTYEKKCNENGKYKHEGDYCTPKFGLGIAQWTGERTIDLLDEYIYYKNITKIDNNPTIDQCTKIESNFIVLELTKNEKFKKIYDTWLEYPTPYYAGYIICLRYEIPYNTTMKGKDRGDIANNINKKMGCNCSSGKSINNIDNTISISSEKDNDVICNCDDIIDPVQDETLPIYFKLSELYRSDYANATSNWNQPPDEIKEEIDKKLTTLIVNCLDPIRENYGDKIAVTSGYRNEIVNLWVTNNEKSRSQHMRAEAADLQPCGGKIDPKFGENLIKLYNAIVDFGNYDQFIIERCDWAHVSYNVNFPESNRQEIRWYDGNYHNGLLYPLITDKYEQYIEKCKQQLGVKANSVSITSNTDEDDNDTCEFDISDTEVNDEPIDNDTNNDNDIKTNLGLAKYAIKQIGKPYWYGTYGQIGTQSLYEEMKIKYPKYYTANDFQDQIRQNVKVHGSSGLIKGYLWSETPDSEPIYNGTQDESASKMYSNATEKGPSSSFRKIIGQLVYKVNNKGNINHVGVYIGNNKVIDAKGHAYGVIESNYDNSWKYWSQCPYIINNTEHYCDEVTDTSIANDKNYTISMNNEDKFCEVILDSTDDTSESNATSDNEESTTSTSKTKTKTSTTKKTKSTTKKITTTKKTPTNIQEDDINDKDDDHNGYNSTTSDNDLNTSGSKSIKYFSFKYYSSTFILMFILWIFILQ